MHSEYSEQPQVCLKKNKQQNPILLLFGKKWATEERSTGIQSVAQDKNEH